MAAAIHEELAVFEKQYKRIPFRDGVQFMLTV